MHWHQVQLTNPRLEAGASGANGGSSLSLSCFVLYILMISSMVFPVSIHAHWHAQVTHLK